MDIIKCFVFMYVYFNIIAFLLCLMSIQFMNNALHPSKCRPNIHEWTYIMLGLICINNLISFYMAGSLVYLNYRRRPDIFVWHVGFGRFCVLTRSTTSQHVYYSVYAQDFISLVIGLFGWPLMKDALDCDEGYEMFYLLTLCY